MIGAPAILRAADHSTLFQGLRALDFRADEAASVSGVVRAGIAGIKNCGLVSERTSAAVMKKEGMAAPCADRACALRAARGAKADRVIYGTVSRATRKYDARVANEGAGKYLLAEKAEERYVMTLYLVDAGSGAVITAITETAPVNAVRPAAGRIAARLRKFYADAGADDTDTGTKTGGITAGWYVLGGPSGFLPFGAFRSMARGGAGLVVSGGAQKLAGTGVRLGIQAGYWFVFPSTRDIESHHAVSLSAVIAYAFLLPRGFELAPVIGLGYIFHVLSQDAGVFMVPGLYRYSDRRYFDPHLFLRLEASYSINDHWAVVLAPGYFVFFEKGSTGMMATLDAAARYSF